MLRFLSRSLGFILLAAAFAALVVDGSRSIAGGRPLFASLGAAAAWLGGAHAGTDLASGWPAPVREATAGLLAVPAFAVGAALGLLLLRAGRSPSASSRLPRGRA